MKEREYITGFYTDKDGEEIAFHFVTDITIDDKINFIKTVKNILFITEDFFSVLKDFAINYAILSIFTDIFDTLELDTYSDLDAFFEDTNVVYIVKDNMKYGLYEELIESVDDCIAYATGIHKDSLTTALSDLIKSVTKSTSLFNSEETNEILKELLNGTKITEKDIVNQYFKKKDSDSKGE